MTELTMTTAPAPTTPSAIPKSSPQDEPQGSSKEDQAQTKSESTKHKIPHPKLRLHAEELRHPSSSAFLSLIPDVASTLDKAIGNIVRYLYKCPRYPKLKEPTTTRCMLFEPSIPPTRSVTVFLRDFDGVAYTTGSDLDDDHKEIHLSLPYIKHCTDSSGKADPLHELVGVLTHELVHCYQHTTPPEAEDDDAVKAIYPPGGLIEGIADFVRLKAGLAPPHWKRPRSSTERASTWDAGYQHTAYFLAWIEDVRVGEGAIGMLNDRLLRVGYVDENEEPTPSNQVGFWMGLFGVGVADLWDEYGRYLDGDGADAKVRGNWEDEILNPE
ncbi:uncharacterized protein N7459_007209 [Penicillium hispanicum]|uniref:uncharacterized protein n=1 Tax=Penicillium hispanicum TaxID=1080232 RepID=UPI00254175CB|nr:uncharacterized protein N7459_007209 [Penicillium hispanicum]KAJ5578245.1 hypothetical protein N7459_007209 [Penicillium hispanicum]